jgi:hypothetical protein
VVCLIAIGDRVPGELTIRPCSGTCGVCVVSPEGAGSLAYRLLHIDVCGAHPTLSNLFHINFRTLADFVPNLWCRIRVAVKSRANRGKVTGACNGHLLW